MRQKRSIRHRKKRLRREVLDLDITSLLDILVIILVFLLKSYNTSGVFFNVPLGISIPKSKSKDVSTVGVVIQVSKQKVWVDDELIIKNLGGQNLIDHGGRRLTTLFDKLVEKRRIIERTKKNTPKTQSFKGTANLIIDKKVKYHLIKKILYTAAEAKFLRYKFVVTGEDS